MNFLEYNNLFQAILTSDSPQAPYDSPAYFEYTKLNASRQSRWIKKGELKEELVSALKSLNVKQEWIIITEPWCGDAAHSVPFLVMLAELSTNIQYDIVLRDTEPFLINDYLTNGGKSIPKLVIRDAEGKDLFVWGPRPTEAQDLMIRLKNEDAPFETIKLELQNWYNKDKGVSLQHEFLDFFKSV